MAKTAGSRNGVKDTLTSSNSEESLSDDSIVGEHSPFVKYGGARKRYTELCGYYGETLYLIFDACCRNSMKPLQPLQFSDDEGDISTLAR